MASKKPRELMLRLPARNYGLEFGAWARRRRDALGKTQEKMAEEYNDLATKMGVTQRKPRRPEWFSHLENARVQFQEMAELEILSNLYDVSMLDLIAEMGFDVSGNVQRNGYQPDITDLYTLVEELDDWERDTIMNLYRRHLERADRDS